MPVIKEYREPAEAYIVAAIIIVYLVVSPLFYTFTFVSFMSHLHMDLPVLLTIILLAECLPICSMTDPFFRKSHTVLYIVSPLAVAFSSLLSLCLLQNLLLKLAATVLSTIVFVIVNHQIDAYETGYKQSDVKKLQ